MFFTTSPHVIIHHASVVGDFNNFLIDIDSYISQLTWLKIDRLTKLHTYYSNCSTHYLSTEMKTHPLRYILTYLYSKYSNLFNLIPTRYRSRLPIETQSFKINALFPGYAMSQCVLNKSIPYVHLYTVVNYAYTNYRYLTIQRYKEK